MSFQWMLDKPEYAPLFESAEDMGDAKKIGFDLSTLIPQLVYHAPDGSVPKIPLLRTTQGMMVNDDLLKKEGIEIPTTYNQFVAACQKLKAAGYKSPILAYNSTLALAAPLVYAYFSKTVRTIPGAVAKLNTLSSDAGEFMRPTLEKLKEFIDMGFIDLDECNKIKNDYAEVILRFFEGDVPMMVVSADVVSGTKKREKLSESFMKQPFKYSFHTVPMTNDGGDFLSSVSVEFSVNKNSKNILVANEFIRFLIRTDELNNLAQIKRLVTCSTDYSFDEVYAALEKATPIYINEEGITDNAYTQLRNAAYQLILGNMTIDEAIANYGKF